MDNLNFDKEALVYTPKPSEKLLKKRETAIVEGQIVPVICAWHNAIIYGMNDYLICKDNNVKCDIQYLYFENRTAMWIWLCEKHLENISKLPETIKKYMIGKLFIIKRVDAVQFKPGSNQISKEKLNGKLSYRQLADKIAAKYFVSYSTVEKYGRYAEALDIFYRECPELTQRIINGSIRLSHENLEKLASAKPTVIRKAAKSLIDDAILREKQNSLKPKRHYGFEYQIDETIVPEMKIKITPEYNPDVEVNSLNYTVPSWQQSVDRVCEKDLTPVSRDAKDALTKSLHSLVYSCYELMDKLRKE